MVLSKVRELATAIAEELGINLYDVELKNTDTGKVLRVYLTRKDSGVSIKDCSRVSRALSQELDVLDLIPDQYFLEVSSPGLERSLKTTPQFEQAIDENVKITYQNEGKKDSVKGVLKQVSETQIVVKLNDSTDKSSEELRTIPFESIQKAKTIYDFRVKKKE